MDFLHFEGARGFHLKTAPAQHAQATQFLFIGRGDINVGILRHHYALEFSSFINHGNLRCGMSLSSFRIFKCRPLVYQTCAFADTGFKFGYHTQATPSANRPMNATPKLQEQTLLIDFDDTLCENNIYFERAISDFITFLDHREHSRDQVRAVLNQAERDSIVTHGYGLHSFAHSLVTTFERLSVEPITPELHKTISSFA